MRRAEVKQVSVRKGVPSRILLALNEREAALLVRMIGKTSSNDRNVFQRDGGDVGSNIYDALDSVFDMFYEDGINEVER